ncbi:MAG: 1-acyl-sn-glycerol-3-phosphate acyltransferase [Dehalococcoidales bacterium]|nr:1-acyl-sn-glycerol-3-phosphate acyltransferase [Dehalococcoidales bacterium]
MRQRFRKALYLTLRSFALPFFKILFSLLTRYRVTGQENVPENGPLLIVANHLSDSDQYLLYITIKRRIMFMAKEELFRSPLVRALALGFGAFPVRQNGASRQALVEAYRILDSGLALAMFPEGARSRDAGLRRALPGTALIALDKKVPILPVGITGMEAKWKGVPWAAIHRPRIKVTIGRPFYLPDIGHRPTKAELRELADSIMARIAGLLPPEYHGYYAAAPKDERAGPE